MKSNREQLWEEHLLPIELIQAVAQGEQKACHQVVADFKKYIEKVCTRKIRGEHGLSHTVVDHEMVEAIEHKLLTALACNYKIPSQI